MSSNTIKGSSEAKISIMKVVAGVTVALCVVVAWQMAAMGTAAMVNGKDWENMKKMDPAAVVKHVENMIEIGNSEFVYEKSRSKVREYIRDSLVQKGFDAEQILWHRFEWQERKADGRNITTTTWTGINILVWTNTTELPMNEGMPKVRVFGAHYDTVNWGENVTAGAHDNLAGTALLMEIAAQVLQHQKRQKELNQPEIPYLFVFFDHEEPGAYGSKTFIDFYKVGKNLPYISYFIDVDSIGYKGAAPIIQTYPYEDKGETHFTPKWLAHMMLQSSFYSTEDGMNVGHPSILNSLYFQTFRYHLISVNFLSDDGPFTWAGVPSLLFTDLDVFFDGNPDYHKITDLPQNLDLDVLGKSKDILTYFILATENPAVIPTISTVKSGNPLVKFAMDLAKKLQGLVLAGEKQYVAFGPFTLGFAELASISLALLFVIYNTSFQHYRAVCRSREIDNPTKYLNHRVLFFHLFFMSIAVLQDTAFAFVLILTSFPALLTLNNKYLGMPLSLLSTALNVNYLMMSFLFMDDWGRNGPKVRVMKLTVLITIYVVHSLLTLAYSFDYYAKKRSKPKQE